MIIRRIEVHDFRKLTGRLVIDGLTAGLTVVAGDNEDGKSTLLQCIRTAFFEKHTVGGDRAASFQPYHSKIRPEVRIEFELEGKLYKLFKAFCQRPEAELITPTGRFTGSAAEDELAKLLRFTPKRGRKTDSDRDHEGIFGMFWVEQGRSFAPLEPNEDGRSAIVQALQNEVGDVLGGKRGQRIRAEVARLRAELLTAGGKPRGKYAEALGAVIKLEDELGKVEELLTVQESNTEELQRCRSKIKGYQQESSLERARSRLEGARLQRQKIEGLRQSLDDAEKSQTVAQIKRQLAVDRVEQRGQAVTAIVRAHRKVEQLLAEWQSKERTVAQISIVVEDNEKAAVQACAELDCAERKCMIAEIADQLQRIDMELVRLDHSESEALQAKAAKDVAVATAASIRFDRKDLARLKQFEAGVTSAQARLEATATHIHLKLADGLKAKLNNTVIAGEEERKITRTTTLNLAGSLELTITPGSGVEDPELQLEGDLRLFKQELARLGVETVSDAEALAEERASALNEAEKNTSLVHAHAPEGIEKLQECIVALTAEKERLLQLTGGRTEETHGAVLKLEMARPARDVAKQKFDGISRKVQQCRKELAESSAERVTCKANYEAENQHCHEAQRHLENARKEVSDAQLNESLLAASHEGNNAASTVAAAATALEAADPDLVARELRIAETAVTQIEGDIQILEEKAIRFEAELRANGALGLGERKQEVMCQLANARATAALVEREAKSRELLNQILAEAEHAARECFLRPVSERVQPYLKLLLPGSELALDESLHILGLRRNGLEEKFDSLSLGTREQLAVLTRLAFADLLREQGHPATVLLDDAVVYADDSRFDRMLHILQKAAQQLQIIVLTCRERDYQAGGAPIIRLTDCSTPRGLGISRSASASAPTLLYSDRAGFPAEAACE